MASGTSFASQDTSAAPGDRRWLILVVVAVAQLMVVLDATIVNIALPSAQLELGFPNGDRQWVITAYALAFGSLLLVGGRIGDMFSRKWVFITGLIGFALASALGGAAGSFEVLVVARALQGAFGALLAPSALGTLVSTFRDPRERGRAFGVFGFSHAETSGWSAGLTIGSLVLGVVLLAGFVLAELRATHPLLPLRVILDRTRGGAYLAVFISGIAIFGTFLFLTYYLQVVKGESPFVTGLLFLPMIGCILISSNLSSIVLLPRLGPRVLIAAGMLLGAGGMAYLTQVTVTSSYAAAVLPALLVLGLGFGMIFAPAINTATFGVAREDSGVASALVNTMQQVGGSIGTSALSTIALTATASYLIAHHVGRLAPAIAATHGYTIAFGVSAGLLGLGFVLAIALLPAKQRLAELRHQAQLAEAAGAPTPASTAPAGTAPAGTAPARPIPARTSSARTPPAEPVLQPAPEAIPAALCSCSPVVHPVPDSEATRVR